MKRVTPTNRRITHYFLKLTLIALTLLSISCSDEDNYIDTSSFAEQMELKTTYTSIETAVFNSINTYREANNLQTLTIIDTASTYAMDHNFYMIDNKQMNHDNFETRSSKLINQGAKLVLENVAFGYRSEHEVMEGWLNSEGHKNNIENSQITHIGLSIEKNERGSYYYTTIFIKK